MNRPAKSLEWTIWGGLFVVMAAIFVAFALSQFRAKPLPVFNALPDFTLTDQNGKAVSLASLRGSVWVTDVIFTRCPGQCLRMSENMKQLRTGLPDGVKLVSVTTDPNFDTPAIFKKYAEHLGVDDGRWIFLTGEKPAIKKLVFDGLKLNSVEKKSDEQENPNDLFVHSTKFVLIDQRGQVRGWFEGETGESNPELLAAIKNLLREKN